MSKRATATPHFLPAKRVTLVAPMFPDPRVLISFHRSILTARYPDGMDPKRYPAITHAATVIIGDP